MSNKESGVDPTKQHILLGYCLGGPHGQFGSVGGSGYLPCSQIGVPEVLKTAFLTLNIQKYVPILRFFVGTTLPFFV